MILFLIKISQDDQIYTTAQNFHIEMNTCKI